MARVWLSPSLYLLWRMWYEEAKNKLHNLGRSARRLSKHLNHNDILIEKGEYEQTKKATYPALYHSITCPSEHGYMLEDWHKNLPGAIESYAQFIGKLSESKRDPETSDKAVGIWKSQQRLSMNFVTNYGKRCYGLYKIVSEHRSTHFLTKELKKQNRIKSLLKEWYWVNWIIMCKKLNLT